jgi:hypothetical protein
MVHSFSSLFSETLEPAGEAGDTFAKKDRGVAIAFCSCEFRSDGCVMDTSSFVVALVASCLTLNEMIDHSGTLVSVIVATCAGFMFGLIAQSMH